MVKKRLNIEFFQGQNQRKVKALLPDFNKEKCGLEFDGDRELKIIEASENGENLVSSVNRLFRFLNLIIKTESYLSFKKYSYIVGLIIESLSKKTLNEKSKNKLSEAEKNLAFIKQKLNKYVSY